MVKRRGSGHDPFLNAGDEQNLTLYKADYPRSIDHYIDYFGYFGEPRLLR
jgi:hypothetical protein